MQAQNNYKNIQIYQAGLYLRLSREDEVTGQSVSIGNQKDFLMNYVLEQGWNITDIYIDDGYTGLNFDRPEFKRMIADIENKKVNLVITKDLSRLGRDYIDTGYYLERYFPQKAVRYIALSDGIDTFENTTNNDMSPFKAVINDMYAKDISKKIRTVMDTKRINGQFIGAFAPYGYVKDEHNKNMLLVDEESAKIVKRIFTMYLSGCSMAEIVRVFNREQLLTPTEYKNQVQNLSYVNVNVKTRGWRMETIKRILTNPTYIGNMAQHRSEKINYKVKKFKKIPPSDWIIAEHTHEAIIDEQDFAITQQLIQKKASITYPTPRTEHLLGGLLVCGDCEMPMTFRRREKSKEFIAICSGYSRFGKEKCNRNVIDEALLNDYVISDLKSLSKRFLHEDFLKHFSNFSIDNAKQRNDIELAKICKRQDEIRQIIKSLYEDKVKGILTEADFLEMSAEYDAEKSRLAEKQKELIHQQTVKEPTIDEFQALIIGLISHEKISPIMISQLIKKVEIFKNKEIIIHYRFQNPYGSSDSEVS